MHRRTAMLTAALAASTLAASPALADPHAIDSSNNGSGTAQATSTRTWSPGDNLPAYPTPEASKYTIEDGRSADTRAAAKEAEIQPGQPTWPVNPRTLPGPAERAQGSTRGGATDNDDIWLVLGIGLAGAALAGAGAGAARYVRVRAPRGRLS